MSRALREREARPSGGAGAGAPTVAICGPPSSVRAPESSAIGARPGGIPSKVGIDSKPGDGSNGARAAESARAEGMRLAGSFSRAAETTASSSGGASGRAARSVSGASARIDAMTTGPLEPSCGVRPVTSSNKTTPSAQTSLRGSTLVAERTCSGDM